jgi:CRISPR-associated protein Cas2
MLVLVTYDICMEDLEGKRRLRRVAKHCLNYGVRVQNSVFECRVDAAQLVQLKHLIRSEMDEAHDSVRFYVLGNRYQNKVEHYGVSPAPSMDEPLIL